MKILHVITHLDARTGGGYAERLFQMAHALQRSGIENYILSTDYFLTKERMNEFFPINLVILKSIVPRFFIPRIPFGRLYRLVDSVDVIHLMGHWSFLNIVIYLYAMHMGKPYICSPAGALKIFGRSKILKIIFNIAFGNRIINNASANIAVGENETEDYMKYGYPPEKVYLMPNGINEENYVDSDFNEFREKFGIGSGPYILFLGRLNLIKGPDLLLEAFEKISRKYSELQLVFAGPDENMLSSLKEYSVSHDLESRVHFIGFLAGRL
ncbi:MAG: glycosyltransferase, partial [Oligoflexales bacterium]|nr:glycosyltransferase [Oligoflexales bacterium]